MPLRNISIATKLPVTLAVLLSSVLFAMALAGYAEVRETLLARAADQLGQASGQIAGMLAPSVPQRIAALRAVASAPEILASVTQPEAGTREALLAKLEALHKASPTASLEVWNADRQPLITIGATLPALAEAEMKLIADTARQAGGPVIGPFVRTDDMVMQVAAAPIIQAGITRGFYVDRRRLTSSPQSLALISGLVGPNARLLIGNAADGFWTDFVKPVTGPPKLADVLSLTSYTGENGVPVFARARAIPGTPWLVATEFPQAPVLLPLQRYVRRAIMLSLTLAVAGAGLGWLLSQRVTRPLQQMTDAAESVAAGLSSKRIGLDRRDELGRLAAAFDTMVEEVERGREHLERRVAERTAELETANHELEAFSYSISHDLRAPLRAILGFSTILVEDHAPALPAEARKHLDTIARNTRAMGQLIDDLLSFSRVARQPIAKTSIAMESLVQSAITDVRHAEPLRVIDFIVNPLPPAWVQRPLMKQVVDNLVQNAAKFTRHRPDARIEIGCLSDAEIPTYFIRDNGAGFDMQYVDKLFGVFQRLHRADEFEGTGVGLAIVRRIVTRHGGQVWAEGAVGQGATFFFALPDSPESSQE